jgi:hypothetical protein
MEQWCSNCKGSKFFLKPSSSTSRSPPNELPLLLRISGPNLPSEVLERVSRAKAENVAALDSAREDTEGFARKITLLEDELAMEHQTQEVSERECRE